MNKNILILSILLIFLVDKYNCDKESESEDEDDDDSENRRKAERAETLLKKKIDKLLILDDGSTLKIPKFKKLGSGSFAFTLRAKFNGKTDVAVKFTLRDSDAGLKHEYLMYEKIGAASDKSCEERGIPYVYYFGRITHYYDVIIMTFVDRNLDDEFDNAQRHFTRETQLQIFMNLLSSLEFVHDRGVFHRDLKPANVMVRNSDRRLFLIDLNLAKDENVVNLQVAGTMLFVSGDSLEEGVDHQQNQIDDLFSLSFVMYYLCGLELPWEASDVTEKTITEVKNNQFLYHQSINKIPYVDLREIYREIYIIKFILIE